MVPAYCCSRAGRVFRLIRSSERIDQTVTRYHLKAVPVASDQAGREVSMDLDATLQLDKLRLGQAVATPEGTFESLWEQLQIDINLGPA
ncbi:MAG: hypothetical protein JOZ81_04670 [Chloroflexi bacterium]|nr:hypothetical protein [Chloroflexota bacterium]